ncbi:DUF58 domain-containing protein [Agromyces aerolatus]|uniref:DUF58 domain-containing protein n=1 Tax=Agromyces sp. LY-1074 TaxID=3074080 RepID=UPI0028625733|nr:MULTISPECIES: DUF58 domain-containing protein [unclassified Agromyces]MDR5700004.1 DUF58 domain-containing protein [Agromyces sp. LY-1074]MDR5706184.1 DUF58 domain-containing protein [Agromyces sp. LY-1358]
MTTTDQDRPAGRISQTRFALGTVARATGRAVAALGARVAAGARRVGEAAHPVTAVVSTIGWLVLGAALVAGLVALVFGWVEFAFLSATLAGAVLVAVPFVFGRMKYRVAIELTPRRVVAGERAFGRLLVVNDGTSQSVSSRIELPVGDGSAEFRIPPLAPAAEHEELFAVPTHRRAVIVAGPAVSVRGDELGLLRRTVRWNDPVELFVHPRTARLKPSAAGLVRDLEGEVTKTITDHDISFHALRAYEPGDPLRNVHWRSSARTGRLMVRQYEETRRSELVLLQATATDHYADDDEFELAVSVFASVGVQVVRDWTKMTAQTEAFRLRASTPVSLLDDTSRIVAVADRTSLREFARETVRRTPGASVVMLVVGSRVPLAEVRAVETVLPSDAQLLVFRAQRGAEAKIARIGGTAVATVGELGELPAVIRKVRP